MMMVIFLLLTISKVVYKMCRIMLVVFLVVSVYGDSVFSWGKGKEVAVCLTYDDGLKSHIDSVIPALNKYGLKGTFFMQSMRIDSSNFKVWRKASKRGHELGNHSIFHPCPSCHNWVLPAFSTDNYTLGRMIEELKVANKFLYLIDGKSERSYAYPCCVTTVGGIDYSDKLGSMFISARSGGKVVLKTMRWFDIYNVPAFDVSQNSGRELIEYVESNMKNGTMAIFMFHGIGSGYLKVSGKAHDELLRYLRKNKKRVWVSTYSDVMKYVKLERKRVGW